MDDDKDGKKSKEKQYVKRAKAMAPRDPAIRVIKKSIPDDVFELVQPLVEAGKLLDANDDTVLFSLKKMPFVPRLPTQYRVKGGIAREVLRGYLLADAGFKKARDVDIIRFAGSSDSQDHRLSLKYMRDDYEFGRGVEVIEDRPTYFRTRDITANEVLIGHGQLEASYRAIRDLAVGIIRPTPFVTNADGHILGATLLKCLRFMAEARVRGIAGTIEGLISGERVTAFDVALNLERAFSMSEAIAHEYILLTWEHGFLCPAYDVPPPAVDAVVWLSERINQGVTLFKHLPEDVVSRLPSRFGR